jgi:lysine-N-methylase
MAAILQPEYFKQFVCIGSECEDTCCSGWSISIDRQTKAKYRKVPASTIDLKAGMSGDSFKQKQGNCHFLNEDKLCRIQLALGESYLSETCATYPREHKRVGDVI